ncbi:hypothetical protein EBB79_03995 [Parasedimentitalea marina]|uniref:Uncharacterized protein n=1 Tax=Parasedimentitalea marina TaxID=2483033 RepID=A0A3T0MZE2_9RHOB|nr:hypothetical protein [Parasedimentitalea marina]AZV77135.1 hypothetical protein EBB79_03995 [Parasedimentitalea marina]
MRDLLLKFGESVVGPKRAKRMFSHLLNQNNFGPATIHPYGFYIWKLPSITPDFTLRVHAWLPGIRNRQQPDWPPHTHNSDLHSFLLSGTIVNQTWDLKTGEKGDAQVYEVGYSGGLSTLVKTPIVGDLMPTGEATYSASANYLVPAGKYHASEVQVQSSAVTVVLLGNQTQGAAKVAGSPGGEKNYVFDRQDASHAEQETAREIVIEALKKIR